MKHPTSSHILWIFSTTGNIFCQFLDAIPPGIQGDPPGDLPIWQVNSSPGMESSLGARQTADTWNEGGHCGTGDAQKSLVCCWGYPLVISHGN